ncbi:hypothetical protein H4S07_003423 [Coemansia furcata]|uniref:Uncharacterized protein n=1 Tax=Coemansia furcata TaxID=417177 RepID=A0ACC1LHI8_9FUNG|nr:hypothetical protein H4S07_003423 [Coemansia furcata]
MHLGQYVATARLHRAHSAEQLELNDDAPRNVVDSAAHWAYSSIRPSAWHRAFAPEAQALNAMLRAALDTQGRTCAAALAFVGGVAVALDTQPAAGVRAVETFAALAHRVHDPLSLSMCVDVAAQLHSPRQLAELLAGSSGVLPALAGPLLDARSADLIVEIIYAPATRFVDVQRTALIVHATAVEMLIARGDAELLRVVPMLRVVDAVLTRFFADHHDPRRDDLWPVLVDCLACLYLAVLSHGRDALPDAFRSACATAVSYAGGNPQALFAMQPCLLSQPGDVGPNRSAVVLFYLDFFEHLAPRLPHHVLAQWVVPLAARYAAPAVLEYPGPAWFESAHALILSVLESPNNAALAAELVPWYSDLVLELYEDRRISADLLRIAYTAAVRATKGLALAWDRVALLLNAADQHMGKREGVRGEVLAARRRELLLAVAELLVAVPMELLPQLMHELRSRMCDENGAMRKAVVDHCQELVLARADVARKPALSLWVWQLRADILCITPKI